MQNIIFTDSEKVFHADVKKISDNLIKITGDISPNTSGFWLVNSFGDVYGKYEEFTTIYQEIESGFILSNDGTVYVEPEPAPEPYEPTLEEIQESKVSEMSAAQQKVIQSGVNVTLTNGEIEHFTLTDHDQTSLMGLQSQVISGESEIPWHTSDEDEHCKFYSNEDMALITNTAMAWVTWHVTYFRDLRIYIRSLQTKEEVDNVTYGMDIPQEYQSEPLRTMIKREKGL